MRVEVENEEEMHAVAAKENHHDRKHNFRDFLNFSTPFRVACGVWVEAGVVLTLAVELTQHARVEEEEGTKWDAEHGSDIDEDFVDEIYISLCVFVAVI